MTDIILRLHAIFAEDHDRGCQGPAYSCDCGFDSRTWATAHDAAVTLKSLQEDYLKLALHIAPHLNEKFIWSHTAEQIIDAGLQRKALEGVIGDAERLKLE